MHRNYSFAHQQEQIELGKGQSSYTDDRIMQIMKKY
jgi:hypothetical protein